MNLIGSFSLFSSLHLSVRRWNSPWPWTIVCFSSLLCSTTQVGSSWRIFNNAAISFSVSASLTAFIAREYLEFGYLIKSNLFSQSLPFNVFPVFTSLSFTAHPMSPALSWSTGIRLAPAQTYICPMRSFEPLSALISSSPVLMLPLITLK